MAETYGTSWGDRFADKNWDCVDFEMADLYFDRAQTEVGSLPKQRAVLLTAEQVLSFA